MADEMPAQFARAQRDFRFRLLHLVFAEKNLAAISRGLDGLRWMSFGNRQQRDGIRVAPGAFARRANALPDFFEVVGQIHEAIVNRKS